MAEIRVGASLAKPPLAIDAKTPLHILLVGNFRGTGHHADRQNPRPILVDRDNLYELPEILGTRLDGVLASAEGQRQDIEFNELEDFEPDALFQRLTLFDHLRTLRRRLQNPKHFQQAAAEVHAWSETPPTATAPTSAPTSAPASMPQAADGSGLLDSLLEQQPEEAQSPLESGDWGAYIQQILAESDIQRVDPQQDQLVAVVDQAIQVTMRGLLQGPIFRQLERNWLGLRLLTLGVETHAKLKFFLLDTTAEHFHQALAAEDWQTNWLARALTGPANTPGDTPWGVIGCLFPLKSTEEDLSLASRLGELVASVGATGLVELRGTKEAWLEEGTPQRQAWQGAQAASGFRHLAALWPQVQLRLPYGQKYRQTEQFALEEIVPPGHDHLAWGSPVWLAALALAQSYNQAGWKLDPSAVHQFGDLPLYFDPTADGDAHPCGRYLLTDNEAAQLMELGLSPVISFKNQDRVQIRGLQAAAGGRLHGLWQSVS